MSRVTSAAERCLKYRDLSTRSGQSEPFQSGMPVTGGLVWLIPVPPGGFGAVGRRPAYLDRAVEALPERG